MKTIAGLTMLVLALPFPLLAQNGPFSAPARISLVQSAPIAQAGELHFVDVWIDLSGITGRCADRVIPTSLGGYIADIDFDPRFLLYEYALPCPTVPDYFAGPVVATNRPLANSAGSVRVTHSAPGHGPSTQTNACYARIAFRARAATAGTTVRLDCGPEGFDICSALVDPNGGCGPLGIPLDCEPPLVVAIEPGCVSLPTAALPLALVGHSYAAAIPAGGGVPPYSFASCAALPVGLSLDAATGAVGGIPQHAGAYSLCVSAVDAAGCADQRTYELIIGEPCASDVSPPVVTAPSPVVVGAMNCGGSIGVPEAALGWWLGASSAADSCATLVGLPLLVGDVEREEDMFFSLGITYVDFRWQDGGGNVGSARSWIEVDLFFGDLNADGKLGAIDLLALARYVRGSSNSAPPFSAPADAADLDLDLDTDEEDLRILARKLVGEIDCVPVL